MEAQEYALGFGYPRVWLTIVPHDPFGIPRHERLPISWSEGNNKLRVIIQRDADGASVRLDNFGDQPLDVCITHIDGLVAWKLRRAEPQTQTFVGDVQLISRGEARIASLVVAPVHDDSRRRYQNPLGLQLEVVSEELVTGSNPLIAPVLTRSAAT